MSCERKRLLDKIASSSSSLLRFSEELGGDMDADDTPEEVDPGDMPPSDSPSSRERDGGEARWA